MESESDSKILLISKWSMNAPYVIEDRGYQREIQSHPRLLMDNKKLIRWCDERKTVYDILFSLWNKNTQNILRLYHPQGLLGVDFVLSEP